MLYRFFAANGRVCDRLAPYLPQANLRLLPLYEQVVTRYINAKGDQIVVDTRGGKICRFARQKNPASGMRIIAVDVSAEELEHNADVPVHRLDCHSNSGRSRTRRKPTCPPGRLAALEEPSRASREARLSTRALKVLPAVGGRLVAEENVRRWFNEGVESLRAEPTADYRNSYPAPGYMEVV